MRFCCTHAAVQNCGTQCHHYRARCSWQTVYILKGSSSEHLHSPLTVSIAQILRKWRFAQYFAAERKANSSQLKKDQACVHQRQEQTRAIVQGCCLRSGEAYGLCKSMWETWKHWTIFVSACVTGIQMNINNMCLTRQFVMPTHVTHDVMLHSPWEFTSIDIAAHGNFPSA